MPRKFHQQPLAKGVRGVVNNMRKWELVWAEGLRHCCKAKSGTVSDWEMQVLDHFVHLARDASMIHWL